MAFYVAGPQCNAAACVGLQRGWSGLCCSSTRSLSLVNNVKWQRVKAAVQLRTLYSRIASDHGGVRGGHAGWATVGLLLVCCLLYTSPSPRD